MKLNRYWKYVSIALFVCVVVTFQNCGSTAPSNSNKDENKTSSFDFDQSGPTIIVSSAPNPYVKTAEVHFELIADDNEGIGVDRIEYLLDDSEQWVKCSNILDLSNLEEGSHKIFFRALDLKGNIGKQKLQTWTIDNVAPEVTLSKAPPSQTTAKTATFQFAIADTSGGSIKSCKIDGAPVGNCVEDEAFMVSGLTIGYHEFVLQAVDGAGNARTVIHRWAVTDGTNLPIPVFEIAPADYINTNVAKVKIEAIPGSGFTFSCKLDGNPFPAANVACVAGQTYNINVVQKVDANGVLKKYVFEATVKKTGLNSATVKTEWFVDTTVPKLAFAPAVSANQPTNNVTVHFKASDNGALKSTTCKIDDKAINCVNDHDNELTGLAGGSHTYVVTAIDKAGNSVSKTATWTNKSCVQNDLDPRWVLSGVEGKDWAAIHYFDADADTNQLKDFNGATGAEARTIDNKKIIVLTTGDKRTLTSDSAKVRAIDAGEVFAVVKNQPSSKVYIDSAIGGCKATANIVGIKHSNGFKSYYSSLQDIPAGIVVGANVNKGTILGTMGVSACVKFPQVQFKMENCSGTSIDPINAEMKTNLNANQRTMKFVNLTMHDGTLNHNDQTDLNTIMLNPVPRSSFKKNKTMTLTGYISGGISTDKFIVDIVLPGATSAIRILNGSHGAGAGRFFSVGSGSLGNKTGTGKWRLYQMKANTTELVDEVPFEITN